MVNAMKHKPMVGGDTTDKLTQEQQLDGGGTILVEPAIETDGPWLRKVLDDAKEAVDKWPQWAKR